MTDPKSTLLPIDEPLTVCVVAHTHWDREWYHSAGRFRQGLVALVDALLSGEIPAAFPFLLDGQAVVLEDYLSIRPDMAAALAERLQRGELEAGPWYVLADGLIPSGEAMVRNLLVGRRVLRRFGATAPSVAYCPDTFGHSAAIPVIANGFGFPLAIVWRGYGSARWPKGDVANWVGADGSKVLLYHLPPDGYETGSALPVDADHAAKRWAAFSALMRERTATGVVLLPNGADHHALQPDIEQAVAALSVAAGSNTVLRTSLSEFSERLRNAASEHSALPTVRGELRDSYGYTWTLNGTFGTRAHQKRANARAERLLLRDVEPWTVLAWLHGGDVATRTSAAGRVTLAQLPALLDANWRTLLRAHPHDTLCGCSIDAVARAMDVTIESAVQQAEGLRAAALQLALQHDSVKARARPLSDTPKLVIRNRVARWRGGLAEVVLDETIGDVAVGPSSAAVAEVGAQSVVSVPKVNGFPVQTLESTSVFRRRESPQHYPDNDLVREQRTLVWVPPVPPVGLAAHSVSFEHLPAESSDAARLRSKQREQIGHGTSENASREAIHEIENAQNGFGFAPATARKLDDGVELSNGLLTVRATRSGISLEGNGRTLVNVLTFESSRDVGDSYTPSIRGTPQPLSIGLSRVKLSGPLRASAIVYFRSDYKVFDTGVQAEIILDAAAKIVCVEILGNNQQRHHRLRVAFNTDVVADPTTSESQIDVWADAAFGPVNRPSLIVPAHDQTREMVPPTMPMHRWATMSNATRGATLHADGLAEVEANRESGAISLTLVRAIGDLSLNNLPERPGHAGWPVPIPMAQSLGRFSARIGLQLHDAWSQDTRDAIENASDEFLLPLHGETMRDLASDVNEIKGPELRGTALRVSAICLADDGDGIVLRCINDSEESQAGQWKVHANFDLEFAIARLDEMLESDWQQSGHTFEFVAAPRAVVTVRARRAHRTTQ